MQKRALPEGAHCARCGRTFTTVRQYRFDPQLDHLAICRRECSLLPHTLVRHATVDRRFKVPGGVWDGGRVVVARILA